MNNKQIKLRGYQIIVEYEKQNNRSAEIIERDGYDILSKNKSEERHIEVKSTNKKRPEFRFLTEREFKTMIKDKEFYLYLVCDVENNPKVYEFRRDDLLQRLKGVELNYRISFRRKDFD